MLDSKRAQVNYCTTREAATMLGISLRTAQLWVESGILDAWKTEGGHRRIARSSIEKLLVDDWHKNNVGPAEPEAGDSGFTIVVAEDDPALLRLYTMNLSLWPLKPRVLACNDGFQALVILGKEKPDMLVLDLHMPGIDGFHMLRALQTIPEMADITIVVVTGLDDVQIQAQAGVPANIPVLAKPVPFAELKRIADRLADRKNLENRVDKS